MSAGHGWCDRHGLNAVHHRRFGRGSSKCCGLARWRRCRFVHRRFRRRLSCPCGDEGGWRRRLLLRALPVFLAAKPEPARHRGRSAARWLSPAVVCRSSRSRRLPSGVAAVCGEAGGGLTIASRTVARPCFNSSAFAATIKVPPVALGETAQRLELLRLVAEADDMDAQARCLFLHRHGGRTNIGVARIAAIGDENDIKPALRQCPFGGVAKRGRDRGLAFGLDLGEQLALRLGGKRAGFRHDLAIGAVRRLAMAKNHEAEGQAIAIASRLPARARSGRKRSCSRRRAWPSCCSRHQERRRWRAVPTGRVRARLPRRRPQRARRAKA